MKARLLLAIALLCGSAENAQADNRRPPPVSAADEARSKFAKGDYAGALEVLERLQRLSPNPMLFWNMAACENKLGHHAKAIAYVERYLAAKPDLPEAEKKRAREFVAAANAYVGKVNVIGNVEGIRVIVDGELLGTTPLAKPLVLDEGERKVRYERAGYQPTERTEKVLAGQELSWTVELASDTPAPTTAPAPAPVTHPATPPNPPPAPAPVRERPPPAKASAFPWILGGAGLLAGGAGGALVGISLSHASDLEAECGPSCPPSRWKNDRTLQLAGDVLIGVGGAAVVGAIVLLVLPRKAAANEPNVALLPTLNGVVLRGFVR